MDGAVWALMDTVSGAGVPVLFGVSRGGRWGNALAVALGGFCGACLDLVGPRGPPWARAALGLGSALASVSFSAALLFRHAAAWDPDMGAALCGIPLFHAVCAPSAPHRGLGTVLAVLSVLSLALGAAHGADSDARGAGGAWAEHWGLLLLCAANAVARGAEDTPSPPLGVALRVALLAGVALWPGAAEALVLGRQDRGTMLVLGLALVTSAMRQGAQARSALAELRSPAGATGVERARRGLMLAVAWCLLAAYQARWARWEDAGWAAGALLLCRAACLAWV